MSDFSLRMDASMNSSPKILISKWSETTLRLMPESKELNDEVMDYNHDPICSF